MKNPSCQEAAGVLIGFNRSGERENCNLPNRPRIDKHRHIKQDARVLHFLKKECQITGAGNEALSAVFTGLLSVHNRQLSSFANALATEGRNG